MSIDKFLGESSSAHSLDASDKTIDSSVANDFWEDFALTDGIQKARAHTVSLDHAKSPRHKKVLASPEKPVSVIREGTLEFGLQQSKLTYANEHTLRQDVEDLTQKL